MNDIQRTLTFAGAAVVLLIAAIFAVPSIQTGREP